MIRTAITYCRYVRYYYHQIIVVVILSRVLDCNLVKENHLPDTGLEKKICRRDPAERVYSKRRRLCWEQAALPQTVGRWVEESISGARYGCVREGGRRS